eukprot:13195612-Alexandrium_andersonii.AAC.1
MEMPRSRDFVLSNAASKCCNASERAVPSLRRRWPSGGPRRRAVPLPHCKRRWGLDETPAV